MDLAEKLEILADSAKYDVACTSSGVDRPGRHGALGSSAAAGICHAFTADGRCVSLLKVLYSNVCSYDCSYCVNRRSNDRPRATFTPRELAELTIGFYRRNYIEGLFLSSAVLGTPDRTMELMIEALRILREEYHFNGYIHAKTIPGADPMLVEKIGRLADRLSVNIELPSETGLTTLAPDKKKTAILRPMGQIAVQSAQSKKEMVLYRGAKPFAPAGQSTQMIIGATPETDRHIMDLTEGLYRKYSLKRVFYSAYLPVVEDRRLPALHTAPAVGGAQIAGNVDAAMQRDGRTAAGVQQRAHGGQIKRTLRRQCADDEAIRPGTAQRLDLAAEQLELVAGVQEIPRPRAHQAAHGQVQLGLDLPQQVGVGRQAAHGQCAAKFQPVRSPLLCGAGGGKAVNADFQQLHVRSHPFAFSPL